MKLITDPKVDDVFANYPDFVKDQMQYLRELVIATAEEMSEVTVLEETLKWGEPSFVTKNGSTLRMDRKEKHQINMQCIFNVPVDWWILSSWFLIKNFNTKEKEQLYSN